MLVGTLVLLPSFQIHTVTQPRVAINSILDCTLHKLLIIDVSLNAPRRMRPLPLLGSATWAALLDCALYKPLIIDVSLSPLS